MSHQKGQGAKMGIIDQVMEERHACVCWSNLQVCRRETVQSI